MTGENVQAPTFSNQVTLGNIAVIVTMLTSLGTGAMWVGKLENRVSNIETSRAERIAATNERMAKIEETAQAVPLVSARVAQSEGRVDALTQRIDSSFGTMSERLDRVLNSVGEVKTTIAVLTQRVEASNERRAENRATSRP